MAFTQKDARAIATKLDAEIKHSPKHDQVLIRYNGRLVARFGIRRSSHAVGHDYIPRQIYVTRKQALDLVNCPLSKEGYFAILREQGKLP